MIKNSASCLTILSFLFVLFSIPILVQEAEAQESKAERNRGRDHQARAEKLRQRVQMPVAVNKAVMAGARKDHVRTMARELIEGDVDGEDFNETMRHGPAISRSMDTEQRGRENGQGLGDFVKQKKNEGLRGKELAGAIHAELNRRGIPAGKKGASGHAKNPMDGDFIPPGQQKQMDRGRSNRNRGQNEDTDDTRSRDSQVESDKKHSNRDRGKSNRNENVKSRHDHSDSENKSGGHDKRKRGNIEKNQDRNSGNSGSEGSNNQRKGRQ